MASVFSVPSELDDSFHSSFRDLPDCILMMTCWYNFSTFATNFHVLTSFKWKCINNFLFEPEQETSSWNELKLLHSLDLSPVRNEISSLLNFSGFSSCMKWEPSRIMTFCKLGTICLNLGPITNFFIPGNCSTISFLPAMNSAFTWTGAFVHGELSSQFLHTTHQSLFQVPSTRTQRQMTTKKRNVTKMWIPNPNTMHLLYNYSTLKLANFQNFGYLANSENGQCLILFRLSSIWRWKFQKLQTCACCGNNSEDLWIPFCWNS